MLYEIIDSLEMTQSELSFGLDLKSSVSKKIRKIIRKQEQFPKLENKNSLVEHDLIK